MKSLNGVMVRFFARGLVVLWVVMPLETRGNIVTNGDLELLQGDTFRTVLPGSSYAGWNSVGVGDVEFDASYFSPKAQGIGCVDLNGVAYQGAISQTLMTTPGVQYRLRFALAGNPGLPGESKRGDKTITVSWGGSDAGFFVFKHLQTDEQSNMRWEYHELLIYGSGQDELRFTSTTSTYNDAGPVIDDISIVPISDPQLLINSQPANQTVAVGGTATFNVSVLGALPIVYQWRFNGTNLTGATASSLVLTNVQLSDAGFYSVVVSNQAGTLTSSNALLTVNPSTPTCAAPPAGLVGWWKGEGNALDEFGINNGTLAGNTAFGGGRVGQAFVFDGSGDGVAIGNPPHLQLQNFTIEAWVKRSNSSVASLTPWGGLIFSCPWGGYGFGLFDDGRLYLTKVGYSSVSPTFTITDTVSFHHVAVTKTGSTVAFYLDGVEQAAEPYDPGFLFGSFMAIGARGDDLVGSFLGSIDEVSVYNRALSVSEVLVLYYAGGSGKCITSITPAITSHPQNQSVMVGETATFSVVAGGTSPLSYQWRFNETNIIAGATANSLVLTNVQLAAAGAYSVVVSNAAGLVTSSNATLTVNLPPAHVAVTSLSAEAGAHVTLPVTLTANGNENAVSGSLNFDPAKLSYTDVTLGSGASAATLLVNTNQLGIGKLGVALALATDTVFPGGPCEIVLVGFTTAIPTNATAATISFGDLPISRLVSDTAGNVLAATFTGSTVSIAAANYEGDVTPRPDGDRIANITDWVMEGRFAARLDYPTNSAEFQRADCSPRTTLGDGAITVTDWVQAGRYAAALDPLTPVGGPSSESPGGAIGANGSVHAAGGDREVSITNGMLLPGQTATVGVKLKAQGDENALGFSLSFDPTKLTYTGATVGSGAGGATLNVNASQAATGKLGIVMALGTGRSYAAGTHEVVKLNFTSATTETCEARVALADQPVPRQVSDMLASTLPANYVSGTMAVNPLPILGIGWADENLRLTWPLWASNYVLQTRESLSSGGWTNLDASASISNGQHEVTQPLGGETRFYRLWRP